MEGYGLYIALIRKTKTRIIKINRDITKKKSDLGTTCLNDKWSLNQF